VLGRRAHAADLDAPDAEPELSEIAARRARERLGQWAAGAERRVDVIRRAQGLLGAAGDEEAVEIVSSGLWQGGDFIYLVFRERGRLRCRVKTTDQTLLNREVTIKTGAVEYRIKLKTRLSIDVWRLMGECTLDDAHAAHFANQDGAADGAHHVSIRIEPLE
jgi:hypothetical protein